LNGNPNGTRGDGTDYDGGLVIAERRNQLTCRGKLTKITATGDPTAGTLAVTATLKLPKKTTIDPARDGARITTGIEDAESLAVDEPITSFTTDGMTFVFTGTGAVQSLRLTPAKRAYKTTLAEAGLTPDVLGAKRVTVGIETGDVCARKTLRCKAKGATVRCK
jgi:hypothetical protein